MDQLEVCEAAARAGGRVLKEWLGKFAVSNKGPRDLVTEADLASQREIKRIVLGAFPDHGFIGEELLPDESLSVSKAVGVADGDDTTGPSGLRWIVDPLDGTTNYVHGYPAYCVSVALARGDDVLVGTIYDPVREECFTARAGGGAFLNGGRIAVTRTESLSDALVAVGFPPQVTADAPAVADFWLCCRMPMRSGEAARLRSTSPPSPAGDWMLFGCVGSPLGTLPPGYYWWPRQGGPSDHLPASR